MPPPNVSRPAQAAVPTVSPSVFALVYLVAALIWLVTTDWILLRYFPEHEHLQTVKGTLFMGLSALLVWALVHKSSSSLSAQYQSLHRQVAFNKSLIAASPVPIIVLDVDRHVVLWSEAAEEVFGWKASDVVGGVIPCFADDHDVWNDDFWERVADGERISSVPCEARADDGRTVSINLSIAPLTTSEDEFIGAVVMLNDVSAQKLAVERLRASERRLRILFEFNPRPMWVYAAESLRFVQVNRAAIDAYGYTDAEFRSMTIMDIRPESERRRLIENLAGPRRHLEHSSGWIHERKDGSQLEVEIDSHTLSLDNEPHVLVVVHDVTDRNRLQRENDRVHRELRAVTARLIEAQEEERRHLARELHDESGAMLTALQLCLQMATSNVQPGNESARSEIQGASQIATELSDKMRQISTSLLPGVLDDLGLVAAVHWFIDRYGRQTGIDIQFFTDMSTDDRLSSQVEVIAYRIIQEALTNVARHAETSSATVLIDRADGSLVVHIIDDGCGFDPQDVAVRNRLGLHGMRERCLLVKGSLTVTSAPGEGTRISAIIPVHS